MATVINATNVVVKIGDVVVGCAQSADFTITRAMDSATCAASGGWAQVSPGQKSWSGSFSAILREFTAAELATNVSFGSVFDMLDDGTEVTVAYDWLGAGRYSGSAYINDLKWSQPQSGNVTWTASYTGNGAITKLI